MKVRAPPDAGAARSAGEGQAHVGAMRLDREHVDGRAEHGVQLRLFLGERRLGSDGPPGELLRDLGLLFDDEERVEQGFMARRPGARLRGPTQDHGERVGHVVQRSRDVGVRVERARAGVRIVRRHPPSGFVGGAAPSLLATAARSMPVAARSCSVGEIARAAQSAEPSPPPVVCAPGRNVTLSTKSFRCAPATASKNGRSFWSTSTSRAPAPAFTYCSTSAWSAAAWAFPFSMTNDALPRACSSAARRSASAGWTTSASSCLCTWRARAPWRWVSAFTWAISASTWPSDSAIIAARFVVASAMRFLYCW